MRVTIPHLMRFPESIGTTNIPCGSCAAFTMLPAADIKFTPDRLACKHSYVTLPGIYLYLSPLTEWLIA